MAELINEQIDELINELSDNGYDTDYDYDQEQEHEHENFHEYQNIEITEEQYSLIRNYILESLKLNPDIQYLRQLFNNIIHQNLINARNYHYPLINKPYSNGTIDNIYLHNPEIDNIMRSFISPRITKVEYETLIELDHCIIDTDYGSKFINSIKFYSNYIIIIFPLDEQTQTQVILKIDRKNSEKEDIPIFTVYVSGNIMILDWEHPTNFYRDITQMSKLYFTKNGRITDIYWSNNQGNEYRDNLLPSHIALRPNKFNNCYYFDYYSKLIFTDKDNELVNFSIHCCDS